MTFTHLVHSFLVALLLLSIRTGKRRRNGNEKKVERDVTGWGGNEKMGATSTCMDEHCPLGWGWEREERIGRGGKEQNC